MLYPAPPQQYLDFRIVSRLGDSLHSEIFKACHPDKPVSPLTLRKIKPRFFSRDLFNKLSLQIEGLKDLKFDSAIIPEIYELPNREIILVSEAFMGGSMTSWRQALNGLKLKDFLQIANNLARELDVLHQKEYIHGGIKPNNIMIHPQTLEVCLIDFIRIIDNKLINHLFSHDYFRKHTLPYISPEQTDQISQQVDHTSDLYSLGMVFYWLISGKPPLIADDPREILFFQLAKTPEPLHDFYPDFPLILSDIIRKLLHKEQDKRYQSCKSLVFDLSCCLNTFKQTGDCYSFRPGQKVFSHPCTLPSIISRKKEKKILLTEYQRVCEGEFRVACLSGVSGIGKTNLAQELKSSIVAANGYFCVGKNDRKKNNIPYHSRLVTNFIETILKEDPDQINRWRQRISLSLGANARILTDLVPKFQMITGKQPPLPPLPPMETQNRFNDTILKGFSCFSSHDRPITVFLDDLQWCDVATLDLIGLLIDNYKDLTYLFLLFAYRHNEVPENPPLAALLKKISANPFFLPELRLNEFHLEDINKMTSRILNSTIDSTMSLSQALEQVVHGNPLLIKESIFWMSKNNLLAIKEDGSWELDNEKLQNTSLPATSMDFFTEKIKTLPHKTIKILTLAACMENSFTMDELALANNQASSSVFDDLLPAIGAGILVKEKGSLSFFHDQVQIAALDMLSKEQKRLNHLQIADALLDAIPDDAKLEELDNIFDLARHLNLGKSKGCDPQRLRREVLINYHAGNKAATSLALVEAGIFYQEALIRLSERSWQEEYDLTYDIKKNLAANAITRGNYQRADVLFKDLIINSKNDLDLAGVLMEQCVLYGSLGEFNKSIQSGNQALALLGMKIPMEIDLVNSQLGDLLNFISRKDFSLAISGKIPVKKAELLLRCYNYLMPSYYLTGQSIFRNLMALMAVFHFGLSQIPAIQSLLSYPLAIASVFLREHNLHAIADQYERHSYEICYRFPDNFWAGRGMACLAWLGFPWSRPCADILDAAISAKELTKKCGDSLFIVASYMAIVWLGYFKGHDYKWVTEQAAEARAFYEKKNMPYAKDMMNGFYHAGLVPLINKRTKDVLIDLNLREDCQDISLLANYWIYKASSAYLFNNQDFCYQALMNGQKYLPGITSTIPERLWHIIFVLNALRRARSEKAPLKKETIIKETQHVLERITYWASLGPLVRPYLAFIKAEKARTLEASFREVRNLYLDAIDLAHDEGYFFLEGLIHENLGGLFYMKGHGQAIHHIHEAEGLYQRCHAEGKKDILKQKYSSFERYLLSRERPAAEKKAPKDKLQKTRAEFEGRLSYVMDHTDTCYCVLDQSLLILDANQAYLDLLGVKKHEDAIGHSLFEWIPKGNLELAKKLVNKCFKQGFLKEIYGVYVCPDKTRKHVISDSVMDYPSHRASCMFSIVRDITEQKRQEQKIRDSLAFNKKIIEYSPIGITIIDSTGQCLATNKSMARMIGGSLDKVLEVKVNIHQFMPWQGTGMPEAFKRVIEENAPCSLEYSTVSMFGKLVNIEAFLVPFNMENKMHVLFMANDISERKRAEEELIRHRDYLDQTNQELESFSYSVSHDLRAPIRHIQGFGELLKKREADLDDNGRHYLDLIIRSSKKMSGLIDDLLQFSRSGRSELLKKDIRLDLLIKRVMKRLKPDMRGRQQVQIKTGDLGRAMADPVLMEQVFYNLLSNAIKFTSKEEQASIEIGIESEEKHSTVYFIKDNGVGFNIKYADTIFDVFKRLHNDKAFPGTGIGLAIVKRIIKRHGGRVWAIGREGNGSRISFSLPNQFYFKDAE